MPRSRTATPSLSLGAQLLQHIADLEAQAERLEQTSGNRDNHLRDRLAQLRAIARQPVEEPEATQDEQTEEEE